MDPNLVNQLIKASQDVMVNAYCPYSNFPVGAALLCQDGTIYTGCNIETATLSGICAERTAFSKAISDGHRKFQAVAISSNLDDFCQPCGVCRQFMAEFGLNLLVIVSKKDMTHEIEPLHQLLPKSFGPQTIQNFKSQSAS